MNLHLKVLGFEYVTIHLALTFVEDVTFHVLEKMLPQST